MPAKGAQGRSKGGTESAQERPKCAQSAPKNALGSQKAAQENPKARLGDQNGATIEYISSADGRTAILWKSLLFHCKINDSEVPEHMKSRHECGFI